MTDTATAPASPQVVVQNGWPFFQNGTTTPVWVANGQSSEWIAPHANENDYPGNGGTTEAVGYYTYETTFSLAGLNAQTAANKGHYSYDNAMVKVQINGTSVGISFTTTGVTDHHGWQTFTITKNANFLPGQNTLDFVVQNQTLPPGASTTNQHNPSGLQVAFSSAVADPKGTVTITSASTTDSQNLTVKYNVTGDDGTIPIQLDVYRSNSGKVNAKGNNQVMVAEITLKGDNATAVDHMIVIGPGQANQFLPAAGNGLRPDPTHPYVDVAGRRG